MPNTYAHWRFGDKCISKLDNNLQEIILKHRTIYNYGVHGPDIFFYYDCLHKNDVNKYGFNMHMTSYRNLLKKFKVGFEKCEDKETALSYILGFTAHFALDSYCHSYVERKEEASKETDKPVRHGRIESQFDKYLMVKDGRDPIKTKLTFSLKPKEYDASIISTIIGDYDQNIIYRSLKDHKHYLDLLRDNTDLKRWFLNKLFDINHLDKYRDLMITKKEFPELADANLRLEKLFNKALEVYASLVNEVMNYLNNGKELSAYFDNHFEAKPNYKEIPVLSKEEEEKYEVDFEV